MEKEKRATDILVLIACVFGAYVVFCLFTGMWPWTQNPYNSYSLQAQAWLDGHLDLGREYSHLEIATYDGKFFISFPPFPSIVLLLFVPFFGVHTPDHLLSFGALLAGTLLAYGCARKLGWTSKHALLAALFLSLGGNLVFVGFCGWVWFLAQSFSFALTMAALFFALPGKMGQRKRTLFSLLFLACAVGCRPFQLLYAPLLLFMLWRWSGERPFSWFRKSWMAFLPAVALGCIYMGLNFARFGSVFEFGHNYLPEFLEAEKGQFSFSYLPENLRRLFRFAPMVNGAFVLPQFDGFAFFLASPLYLSVALRLFDRKGHKPSGSLWLGAGLVVAHLLLLCMHKTMGGWQFGNRYTVDALPIVFYLYIQRKQELSRWDGPLLCFGAGLNLVGSVLTYLV